MDVDINIKKADGQFEPFNHEKLETSLRLAGASDEEREKVLNSIEQILYDGITTKKIYKKAFSELEKIKKSVAVSYSLTEAVKNLGPTGYPFEHFVARVFSVLGYETEVGVLMAGKCVEHEVDFLARHDSHIFMAEAKFHNQRGIKSGIQVALYVKARFDDLRESPNLSEEQKPHSVLLVTNTKFTHTALQYGECVGMKMVSWNYPKEGNLQDLIEKSQLHPVTALSTLSDNEKRQLLNQNIVLCRDVVEVSKNLTSYGIRSEKVQSVLDEALAIINTGKNHS